jgi:hypothetical protein
MRALLERACIACVCACAFALACEPAPTTPPLAAPRGPSLRRVVATTPLGHNTRFGNPGARVVAVVWDYAAKWERDGVSGGRA